MSYVSISSLPVAGFAGVTGHLIYSAVKDPPRFTFAETNAGNSGCVCGVFEKQYFYNRSFIDISYSSSNELSEAKQISHNIPYP